MIEQPKPRVLLLCDRPGWAYDTTARNLKKHLGDQFDFDIKYVVDRPNLYSDRYDLYYVFWWGERYHRLFVNDRRRVVKEISSHRWHFEERYGRHSPEDALERYMHDAGYLVATSRRLEQIFVDHHSHVYHYPLGVDIELFRPMTRRSGDLSFGWAGNIHDETKGVSDILLKVWDGKLELCQAKGDLPHSEMAGFYNSIDVICIASAAEGTPLPLLEAMACGCFPITTDVGVVPEIVVDKENGLIVERSVEAFNQAISWCLANRDFVRQAGRENAALIRRERSWPVVAKQFAATLTAILDDADKRAGEAEELFVTEVEQRELAVPFNTASDDSVDVRLSAEMLGGVLPDKDKTLLLLGLADEFLLGFLVESGYQRIWGIDESSECVDRVRRRFGDRIERLTTASFSRFLAGWCGKFACIIHPEWPGRMTLEQLQEITILSQAALDTGGRIILHTARSPEAGSPVDQGKGSWSDGRPEELLRQLLLSAGFSNPTVSVAGKSSPEKRSILRTLRERFCSCLTAVLDNAHPVQVNKIVVYADKEG